MRAGVSALMIVGGVSLGAFAGCSSDEETTPVTPTEETGVTDTGSAPVDTGMAIDSGTAETAPTDTGGGTDTPAVVAPKIAVVHAMTGVPTSIKMCIHNSLTGWNALIDTPLPEMPTTGLPFGGGGRLAVPASIAPVLPQAGITIYVVPSTFTPPAGKTKCSEIITGGSASMPPTPPAGIVKLNTIAPGSFAAGKSYAVAVIGCPAGQGNNAAGKAKCGPAYDDTANGKAVVLTLDNTTAPSATTMGAQFIHLSPHVQAAAPLGIFASFAVPAGGSDAGTDSAGTDSAAADSAATDSAADDSAVDSALPVDAGDVGVDTGPVAPAMTVTDIAGPVNFADPPTVNPATAKMFTGLFTSRADTRFNLYAAGAGGVKGPSLGSISFAQIEMATTGMATQFLSNNKSWTFVAIGDPTKPAPPTGTDPTFFRVIALPNN